MDRDDPRYRSSKGRVARVMSRKLKQTEYTLSQLDQLTPDLTTSTVKAQLQDLINRGRVTWRIEGENLFQQRKYYKIHPPDVLILDPYREVDYLKAVNIHRDISNALGYLRFTARKLLEGGKVDPTGIEAQRMLVAERVKALEQRLAIMKALVKNPDLWDTETLPTRLYPYLASDNEKTEQS